MEWTLLQVGPYFNNTTKRTTMRVTNGATATQEDLSWSSVPLLLGASTMKSSVTMIHHQ
jgi:hypothetical protein